MCGRFVTIIPYEELKQIDGSHAVRLINHLLMNYETSLIMRYKTGQIIS